jgi:excisionase family DNA binding protein
MSPMDTTEQVPAMLNVEQVAAIFGTSIRTIYRWIEEEKIPYFRRGRTVRCTTKSIEELLGFQIRSSHLVARSGNRQPIPTPPQGGQHDQGTV